MKTNLQYIFDKITRENVEGGTWQDLDRAALIDLSIEIGARDRGVSISAKIAGFLADTMLASRTAGRAEICRLRAALHQQ
jgi:hypothetical protein